MSRQSFVTKIQNYWGQHLTKRQCDLLCIFCWYVYDLLGFRLIWEKFCPPSSQEKATGATIRLPVCSFGVSASMSPYLGLLTVAIKSMLIGLRIEQILSSCFCPPVIPEKTLFH